jgi:hypothetical protein
VGLNDWVGIQSYINARDSDKPASKSMEALIAQNGELAYFYALRVLHAPFPEGEDAISKMPDWAVKYSRFILKRRFIKAEKHIAGNPELCYEYFKYVIKRKLPRNMHQSMIMLSFNQPDNHFIEKYLKEIEK